jgi:penicillin-binding protein 1C
LYDVFSALPHNDTIQNQSNKMSAPSGLARVKDATETRPQILFPPDDAEILASRLGPTSRGFALSARVESGLARFYVDGNIVPRIHGQAIWRPEHPGFYTVTAVDDEGRSASSRVQVLTPETL